MNVQQLLAEQTESKGSYAAVRFDRTTVNLIKQYNDANNTPNCVASSKLHTTVIYSKKYLPNYKPLGKLTNKLIGTPDKLDIWPSQPDEDGHIKHCLVLTYKCPELVERHKFLMKEHDATYDFPKYIPHVTLSYDIGDRKLSQFSDVNKIVTQLTIVREYGEDLDLDFSKTASKDD